MQYIDQERKLVALQYHQYWKQMVLAVVSHQELKVIEFAMS